MGSTLSAAQKTQLQALLEGQELKRGDIVWKRDDPISIAVLISTGSFVFEEIHGSVDTSITEAEDDAKQERHAFLSSGMLIFDYHGIFENRPYTTTLVCRSDNAYIFTLDSSSMLRFLDQNPMILLALLKTPILT